MTQKDWRKVELQEVCTEVTVGHVGPMATEYVQNGVPFLRSLNIKPYRIDTNEIRYITPAFHQKLGKSRLNAGDVVIVRTGAPGVCTVIPDWIGEANCSDLVIARPGRDVLPEYLAYVVNVVAAHHVDAFTVGAVQQHFNVGAAKKISFALPPLDQQNDVVSFIEAISDKIELNRRMNETLEGMAQAIFRDWFVDFGPTRAKMAGRAPYLAPDLWAQFPDQLNEHGRPNGWRPKTVGDLLQLHYGRALKSSDRVPGPFPVYGSSGVVGFHNAPLATGPGIVVGRKGTVGSVYWEDRDFFPIDTAFFVQSTEPLTFCFYLLQTLGLKAMNTDAAVPGLNRENVLRLLVVSGSSIIRTEFDSVIGPFRQKVADNDQCIRELMATRDYLLPKLMSGEITVREAETIAATVA